MSKRALSTVTTCWNSLKRNDSYMSRRLAEVKNENTLDEKDPLYKALRGTVDENPALRKIYDALPEKEFNAKYVNSSQIAKAGNHIAKEARETAMSRPWTGEEHFTDTSLRMILDGVKAGQNTRINAANNIGFTSRTSIVNDSPGISRKSIKTQNRLAAAQDKVLDYRMEKQEKQLEDKEASEFRALYAEKFTPIGSFEKLRSIADVRIEESMRRGGFDSVKSLRGKKNQSPQPSLYVDRTEHHLNDILVRQNISPPWIDKQGSVNKEIESLRRDMIIRFQKELIIALDSGSHIPENFEGFKDGKETLHTNLVRSTFEKWKATYKPFAEHRIESLNSSLRSYNLQAPLSTQKLYLLIDKEFQRVLEKTDLKQLIKDESLCRQTTRTQRLASEQPGTSRQFSFKWPRQWSIW